MTTQEFESEAAKQSNRPDCGIIDAGDAAHWSALCDKYAAAVGEVAAENCIAYCRIRNRIAVVNDAN